MIPHTIELESGGAHSQRRRQVGPAGSRGAASEGAQAQAGGRHQYPESAMIDWQQALLNLRRYKPLSQVAKEVGSDWRHLNRLARGEVQQPRFDTGVRILDLHYDVMPERHREILR